MRSIMNYYSPEELDAFIKDLQEKKRRFCWVSEPLQKAIVERLKARRGANEPTVSIDMTA